MNVTLIDWLIVIASILICFLPALLYSRRSSQSTAEFFASGRSVPWWLAGLSMVATTFSSDTPNWVTEQVRKFGVAGNWQWWAFVLTGVSTVFFFARLWRRSGVLTDLEFYEHRYSGRAASFVRGFRAIYLGLFFNCFIMGMVTLAACKIANILFGLPPWQTIIACGILNVLFAAHTGLWGVLIIDMIQFFIKMTAVFAAAYFSLKEVGRRLVGQDSAWLGLQSLVEKLSHEQVVTPTKGEPEAEDEESGEEEEPVAMDSPLRQLGHKVLLSPHSASFNEGGELRPGIAWATRSVISALNGIVPDNVYNREVIPRWKERFGNASVTG